MKYSKQQIKAINHLDGPALVLAVPGAGKTTVLLERIKNLIANGIDSNTILVMTFSKAQALDMQERFYKKYDIDGVTFSTIHSFAFRILRSFYKRFGKEVNLIETNPNYNKYEVIRKLNYQVNGTSLTDEDMDDFFRVSGFIKNSLLNYSQYRKMYGPCIKNFENVFALYESFKIENNLIDFDDMLVIALKTIKENEDILHFLRTKYKYIQIDEGQDTSLVQLRIIQEIAKPLNNLFVVADDDQSIYGFRGANSKQLLDFKKVYPDSKIYLMEDNYRSTKNIVSLSNKVIKHNKIRYNKDLRHINPGQDKINIIKSKSSQIQTNYVIKEAKKAIDRNESVAILYRNNISSINFVDKLSDKDKFYIKDSRLAFYDHFIIKDIKDIYNFSIDNFDIKTFERIYFKLNMYLKKDFINQAKMMDPSMSVIDRLEECEGINGFYREKIDLLAYYTRKIANLPFHKSIRIIFDYLGYYEYLQELSRRTKTPLINYNRVIDTILNLSHDIETFADFLVKLNKLKEKQKKHSKIQESITLSTIHGSKGLEFDNVYIVDLVENEFPSSYAISADQEIGVLEEERRLFYVGMTRAKSNLTLITLKKLYNMRAKESLFLKEIIEK